MMSRGGPADELEELRSKIATTVLPDWLSKLEVHLTSEGDHGHLVVSERHEQAPCQTCSSRCPIASAWRPGQSDR